MALIDAGVLAALEKEFAVRAAESNDTSLSSLRASLASSRGLPTESDASYALGVSLVFSSRADRVSEGLSTLSTLLRQGYRTSDVIFYTCVGLMHAGRYRECRSHLVGLVSSEPTNERAAALLYVYKQRIGVESYTGMAIYAGVAVVLLGLGYLAYRHYTGGGAAGGSATAAAVHVAAPQGAGQVVNNTTRQQPQPTARLSPDSRVTLTRMSRG